MARVPHLGPFWKATLSPHCRSPGCGGLERIGMCHKCHKRHLAKSWSRGKRQAIYINLPFQKFSQKDEEFTQPKTTKHEALIMPQKCPLGIPLASHLRHGCIKTKLSESIPSMARCRDSKEKKMAANVNQCCIRIHQEPNIKEVLRCWKHHRSMVARKGC